METIREKIIQTLCERAQVIQIGSPQEYNIDFGGKSAFRNRSKVSPSEMPCVCVWADDETVKMEYGKAKKTMIVRIEGFSAVEEGNDVSKVSEQILGDLIVCFTSTKWQRGSKSPVVKDIISSMQYFQGGVSELSDGDNIAGAYIMLKVEYETLIGDPYNQ